MDWILKKNVFKFSCSAFMVIVLANKLCLTLSQPYSGAFCIWVKAPALKQWSNYQGQAKWENCLPKEHAGIHVFFFFRALREKSLSPAPQRVTTRVGGGGGGGDGWHFRLVAPYCGMDSVAEVNYLLVLITSESCFQPVLRNSTI